MRRAVPDRGEASGKSSGLFRVERLVPGGAGFARSPEGKAGFVPGGLPGDVVRPVTERHHKGYVELERWELVEASPSRVEPPCPIVDRCGGCDWMKLAPKDQLAEKANVLSDALVRVGHFRDLPRRLPIVQRGGDLAYRNRLRVHIDPEGRVGLFARKTHELVELTHCAVCTAPTNLALLHLAEAGREFPEELGSFEEAEVRAPPGEGPAAILLVGRTEQPSQERIAPLLERLRRDHPTEVAGKGKPVVEQEWPLPLNLALRVPLSSFAQINWDVNLAMIEALLDGVQERGIQSFCDLYCGAGNFALPLFAWGLTGVGVDRSEASIRAAKASAHDAGLGQACFVAGDVEEEIARLTFEKSQFDLAILDPPRTGARRTVGPLSELAPRFVALFSCDPPTFARDLRLLEKSGYTLESVVGFDMFPQTHHLEALAWLSRSGSKESSPPVSRERKVATPSASAPRRRG